jgi:hypothetical protein
MSISATTAVSAAIPAKALAWLIHALVDEAEIDPPHLVDLDELDVDLLVELEYVAH